MAFAGTFGPSGNLIPYKLIQNIKGESASGYDANGNIKFITADGVEYTPARVDTLIITGASDDGGPPLDATVAGPTQASSADTGQLVSAAPAVNQHGLPANFGPGRGNWNDPTGGLARLRVQPEIEITTTQAPAGQGSVMPLNAPVLGGANVSAFVRNFFGDELKALILIVECIHSIQG
jgi:hypothetical protein